MHAMYDRKRLRKPRAGPPVPVAPQSAHDSSAYTSAASVANAGHDFGAIAVVSPSSTSSTPSPYLREQYQRLFTLSVPRDTTASLRAADAGTDREDREEHEEIPAPNHAAPAANVAAIREPAEGETISLPDIIYPLSQVSFDARPVHGTISFSAQTTETLVNPPDGFGDTRPTVLAIRDAKVTARKHAYQVTASEELDIEIRVCPGNGPHRQINISGDSDPIINSDNYRKIAADLAPGLPYLDGAPPRNHYWVRDLVLKHERFHAAEDERFAAEGTRRVQTWLNHMKARSAADVNEALNLAPRMVDEHIREHMKRPDSEKRAYADGAASYQALADCIKERGDAGGYPSP